MALHIDRLREPDRAVIQRKSVVLIGMMGSGKTTIGRLLARELEFRFLDLDHELERRCGVSVRVIFDVEGEAGFRRRESALVAETADWRGCVLATGGGAVLAPQNRAVLASAGIVIYLQASADELFARLRQDRTRPLLQAENPKQRIAELVSERDPLYVACAHLRVTTGRWPAHEVAAQLVQVLRSYWLPCEEDASSALPSGCLDVVR